MKTLIEKAILVTLNISQWTARKYDNKATSTVEREHNTKDSGRFNKVLIAKEHLENVSKLAGEIKAYHYVLTLPWGNSGERLLPMENYFLYLEEIGKLKSQFNDAVRSFAAGYPSLIEEARVKLNGLFNERDYPAIIENKFGIKYTFGVVPDTADIRVKMSDDELQKLRDSIGAEVSDRFAIAQRSIFERVTDQLQHMSERLKAENKGKEGEPAVFRNSLFENLRALVKVIPRLNITGDARIETMCDELEKMYVDPEVVRTDKNIRSAKIAEVDALLSKVNGFLTPAA